jgi:hypothetical protein
MRTKEEQERRMIDRTERLEKENRNFRYSKKNIEKYGYLTFIKSEFIISQNEKIILEDADASKPYYLFFDALNIYTFQEAVSSGKITLTKKNWDRGYKDWRHDDHPDAHYNFYYDSKIRGIKTKNLSKKQIEGILFEENCLLVF